jgi:hypothetical protein
VLGKFPGVFFSKTIEKLIERGGEVWVKSEKKPLVGGESGDAEEKPSERSPFRSLSVSSGNRGYRSCKPWSGSGGQESGAAAFRESNRESVAETFSIVGETVKWGKSFGETGRLKAPGYSTGDRS